MHGVFSRFLKKFPDSARTLRRTQTLTTVGLFLAIQMVLSSYGTIQVKNDSNKDIELKTLSTGGGLEGKIEITDLDRTSGKRQDNGHPAGDRGAARGEDCRG